MDTSPNAPQPPPAPGGPETRHATSRRFRVPLIAGASVLALTLVGGALWVLTGPSPAPEPEPVAEEAPLASYAGDYLLGHAAHQLRPTNMATDLAELWTERVDDVSFETQIASDPYEPFVEFRALEKQVEAPTGGDPYANDVVVTDYAHYLDLLSGQGDFDDDPVENPEDLMVLGHLEPRTLQYVVKADSGIEGIQDLPGKKAVLASYWALGNEHLDLSDAVLLASGLDPFSLEIIEEPMDSRGSFTSGEVDVYITLDGVRSVELDHFENSGHEVRVLDVPEEVTEVIHSVHAAHTGVTVPEGTFPGQEEEIGLPATWETLVVHADFDEDLAYALVETVYEHLAEESSWSPWVRVDNALLGVDPDRVHPGAARYLEEQGLL